MKKGLWSIALLLCLSVFLMGCGKKTDNTGTDGSDSVKDVSEETESADTETTVETSGQSAETAEDGAEAPAVEASGEITSIVDMSEYWSDLYASNEAAINAYEGMPIMELVTPGLCFVTGVQYDILNINNVDGRFEGELMLAGYPGFVEKKGSQLTFGYEEIVEEDSEYMNSVMGDKKIENGTCDLEKGNYYTDSYTERAGIMIERSTDEFQIEADGSMCCLVMGGRTQNYNKEDELSTSYVFIRSGKNQYDFVIAKSEIGTAYEFLNLEQDMTKEKAISLFEGAGATIDITGGIKDGIIALD